MAETKYTQKQMFEADVKRLVDEGKLSPCDIDIDLY